MTDLPAICIQIDRITAALEARIEDANMKKLKQLERNETIGDFIIRLTSRSKTGIIHPTQLPYGVIIDDNTVYGYLPSPIAKEICFIINAWKLPINKFILKV